VTRIGAQSWYGPVEKRDALTSAAHPIRVLSVDDHPLIRDGIAFALQAQKDMELVAEATNGQEAVDLFDKHRPDVTLMDLQMPVMNGIDAILAIRRDHPAAKLIVLTTYSGDVQAIRAFKAGANGYLLKSMLRKELIETIRTVHSGRRRIPAEIAQEMAEYIDGDALTDREVEVLRKISEGRSNKIVGAAMGISEDTVKTHMKNILAKLQANDRTHAVLIAMKRGFLDG
jgi:DNA-binding NarL/FixJ family response regulator